MQGEGLYEGELIHRVTQVLRKGWAYQWGVGWLIGGEIQYLFWA